MTPPIIDHSAWELYDGAPDRVYEELDEALERTVRTHFEWLLAGGAYEPPAVQATRAWAAARENVWAVMAKHAGHGAADSEPRRAVADLFNRLFAGARLSPYEL